MGSHSIFMKIDTEDANKALEVFKERRENDAYEFGHNEYSGTFATFSGLKLQLWKKFDSREDAEEYILEFDSKWGDAIGVTVKREGKPSYVLIGGWAAD